MRAFTGFVGLVFASTATGFLTSTTHGCLAFGVGLIGATLFWNRVVDE